MSLKNIFKKYTSNHAETTETHSDDQLKTHYYKAMKNKTFNEVLTIFNQSNEYEVKVSSIERGEMIVNGLGKKKVFIVCTVVMVTPNRTAVDFSVTTETTMPTDFGYSASVIKHLYKKIGQHIEYVGSGLGEQLS